MKIQIDNQALPAAVCPDCGCRLYPAELLAAHRERHQWLLAQAVGNGQGWHYGQRPKVHRANLVGRPKLRDSEKVKTVNIKITEVGPR